MDSLGSDGLEDLCRLQLMLFISVKGKASLPLSLEAGVSEITALIARNLAAGRLDRQNRLRAPTTQLTLQSYIDRVILLWSQEQPIWCGLRSHDPECWKWLEQDLTRAARGMLGKRSPAGSAACAVEDYVQRTFFNILRFDYPFDMPLLVWARTILKNTIREPDRSRDALDQWHFSLDELHSPSPGAGRVSEFEPTDNTTPRHLNRIHEREAILRYFAELPPLRRAILILTFFEELPDSEIIKTLEITSSHLYSTRHRALKQLRKRMIDRSMQG